MSKLDLSETSLLFSALFRNKDYYIVYNIILTDDFSPVDYFRLARYEHFDGYQCSIFSSVEDRKKNIITGECDLDWKPQPIEKYFLGYERLSKCYVNTINETIEDILIPDLCNIVQGYLWDTLEIRASEVGMKFPIHVISDNDKYNYYFTNLSNYNDVLLGPSERFFQYHNGIKISHKENYQYITKSDEELLAMLYKKNIKDITWESRLNLVKQVSVVYGNV